MDEALKDKLKAKNTWLRLVFMIVYAIVGYLVACIICLISIVQFVVTIFTGGPNQNLINFGGSLSTFGYQIMQFLAYISEEKPFPFGDWPKGKSVKKAEPKKAPKEDKKDSADKAE